MRGSRMAPCIGDHSQGPGLRSPTRSTVATTRRGASWRRPADARIQPSPGARHLASHQIADWGARIVSPANATMATPPSLGYPTSSPSPMAPGVLRSGRDSTSGAHRASSGSLRRRRVCCIPPAYHRRRMRDGQRPPSCKVQGSGSIGIPVGLPSATEIARPRILARRGVVSPQAWRRHWRTWPVQGRPRVLAIDVECVQGEDCFPRSGRLDVGNQQSREGDGE